MNIYYLDSSAALKRYMDEIGSAWLRAIVDSATSPVLFVSRLISVEITSALNRRLREGTLTPADYTLTQNAFRGDCLSQYKLIPPTEAILETACDLLERQPLRAYDAVHLASALAAQQFLREQNYFPLTFLCADDRLNAAASAEGLQVDNPNHHP
jgi:hypothetical protein